MPHLDFEPFLAAFTDRVRELEIDAGIMAIVAPAGRTISVIARSASITLPEASASGGSSVEALRSMLLAFLGWAGELEIRVEGGELHTPRGILTFELTGAKPGPGLTLALTVAPRGGSEPLRLSVRGAAALGRSLDLAVDVAGSPRIAGMLWPALTPPGSPVAGRVQLQLVADAHIESTSGGAGGRVEGWERPAASVGGRIFGSGRVCPRQRRGSRRSWREPGRE